MAGTKAQGFFWDGYIHWARTIDEASRSDIGGSATPKLYEPVFVQLNALPPLLTLQSLNTEIDSIRQNGGSTKKLLKAITRHPEFAFLKKEERLVADVEDFCIGLHHSLYLGEPFEFFLYRPVARTQDQHHCHDAVFTVIDVGAPALVEQRKSPALQPASTDPDAGKAAVVGAVIDNDIGFLNDRFRRAGAQRHKTRFQAIWLQARERAPAKGGHGNHAELGRILSRRDINRILSRDTRDEALIYREINTHLHLLERFHRAPPRVSHGTAVADLAYGADPEAHSAMSKVPLLGVQLPPEAAMDTSGTHSESYIVQGVRWLCAYARHSFPKARLVINISYGTLAGQKNGSKFIEAQIAREVALARRYPVNGGKGQEVHVVYAFGNSRNARQLAQLTVAPGQETAPLGWIIPPDNGFASFLEIRGLDTTPGQEGLTAVPEELKVTLTAPDGTRHVYSGVPQASAEPPLGPTAAMTATRLFHVPARTTGPRPAAAAFYNLAIAPTRALGPGIARADAGDWQISFENTGTSSVDLVLQIQRGDTAPGFETGGRQSRFDGAFASTRTKGYPTWDVAAPLTNTGTNSAYTTAIVAGQIHTAGALRQVFADTLPAEYSGEGASWGAVQTPSQARVVDQIFTFGVQAAGTYSGSHSRLSGTSAAAALVSRDLL